MSNSNNVPDGMVSFAHPNGGGDCFLYAEQIFGFQFLKTHKCLAAIGPGNALVPIAETLAEAEKKVAEAKSKQKLKSPGGAKNKNGTTKPAT